MNTSQVRAGERAAPSNVAGLGVDPITKRQTPIPPLTEGVGTFVMPSEEFLIAISDPQQPVCVLGPGLKVKFEVDPSDSPGTIAVVCKAGILTKKKPNTFYVDVCLNNYTPAAKEDVVGVVTKKAGDQYIIDIGTRDRVGLSKFAFEGATKKNRPDLKIGDMVFGRILSLPADFPCEITCVLPDGKAGGFGLLEGGYVFRVPVYMIQKLNQKAVDDNGEPVHLLTELGKVKDVPFETSIGANGFIWVKSKSMVINLLIAQAIQAAVDLPVSEYKKIGQLYRESIDALR